jgi:hypothetical protein
MIQSIETYIIRKKDFSICKHCFADLILSIAIVFFLFLLPPAPFLGLYVYFHPSAYVELIGLVLISLCTIITCFIGSFFYAVYKKSHLPLTLSISDNRFILYSEKKKTEKSIRYSDWTEKHR